MMVKLNRGFTIVEIVLFLTIGAFSMLTLVLVLTSSINNERYRDAVYSVHDFLQDQYSRASNVKNDRSSKIAGCSGQTDTVGTSDCSVVGRFIYSNQEGSELMAVPVVSTVDLAKVEYGNKSDKEVLKSFKVKPYQPKSGVKSSKDVIDSHNLLWGTKLVNEEGDPRSLSMLLIVSPAGNVTKTYVAPIYSNGLNLEESIDKTITNSVNGELKLCIQPSAWVSQKRSIVLDSNSVNSSAVRVGSGEGCK